MTGPPRSGAAHHDGLPPGSELAPERQTARWVMRPLAFLQGLRAKHGDVFTVRMVGEQPWVVVAEPELIKEVLCAPAGVLNAGEGNRLLEPLLGRSSLLLLDGDQHMRHRRLLLPPFHGDRMESYRETMRAVTEAELARWPMGAPAAALPRMKDLTLEVIMRAVFGVSEPARLDALREALRALSIPANARDGGTPAFTHAVARADRLVYDEIARHRADGRLAEREDVLSLLLQARDDEGAPMSDREVRDELMTLLVAGHETTATSLAWTLERLARNPDALARTVAEAGDGGGPYTRAVVYETLRMRPVVPMVARLVKQPFELGGHVIPPGVTIVPSVLLVHHRADIYPEPETFRPERFLERAPGTYTWLPFGGGVRRCIGSSFALFEMGVVLSTILARARVRAADPAPEPMRRRAVTVTPAHGASVVLAPVSGGAGARGR